MSQLGVSQLGTPKLNDLGFNCCGSPRGCMNTNAGCAYLRHPWKRAMVFGDTSVRCQATRVNPDTNVQEQCVLNHGHGGACVCA